MKKVLIELLDEKGNVLDDTIVDGYRTLEGFLRYCKPKLRYMFHNPEKEKTTQLRLNWFMDSSQLYGKNYSRTKTIDFTF